MNMAADEHVLDLIPEYALGCLSAEEMALVERHLSACADCLAELDSYRRVVMELGAAVPSITPPAALKTRLMESLPAPATPTRSRQSTASTKPPFWRRLLESLPPLSPSFGYASLALAILLLVGNLFLIQRLANLQSTASSDFQYISLVGADQAHTATGVLVVSHDGDQGTLVVDGLPALDASHQYQLWLIQGEGRVSGGTFDVSKDGYGHMVVASPRPLREYTAFGITIEPAGGSPAPTGARVLAGEFKHR